MRGGSGAKVRIKRAYEALAAGEGRRVLVDRLWPRGLSKDRAHVDEWVKDFAPSTELRQWFGHDPARWAEFQRRYRDELAQAGPAAWGRLVEAAQEGPLTLVYSAKDTQHNDAVVLREWVLEQVQEGRASHAGQSPAPGRGKAAAAGGQQGKGGKTAGGSKGAKGGKASTAGKGATEGKGSKGAKRKRRSEE